MVKKTVECLGWVFVSLTTLALIFTVLTTYQLLTIQYFNNYKMFQSFMICTMLLWAVKIYDKTDKIKSLVYSLCCAAIAVGTAFFMYIGVF
ncbi:hypothetical protein [Clostridium felsineum]|uniref:Uncharacterized protein n=1 Tax=Clostridium felsineum TaxID=36839 RepID=A0A1S8M7X8_9CLOT|nr:hypothetical protein [Clostridium felsineum]MCR3761593.1 hypothetical protein [Clostridium felsineum]URZ04077.1 hypothetical protein CLAUR_041430 [Clostridium felsineum]URZ07673.1 hypothetical protein CLROS_030340 [Clostridium felsineum]URZ12704.1 hypothetical protein CROST_034490 [Clostridium felsineum]URZ15389.1 hypothetical protein CLFE_014070 [Clostridium felsineum DSM 794]